MNPYYVVAYLVFVAVCVIIIFARKKDPRRSPEEVAALMKKLEAETRKDYVATITPNCFGSLNSLVLLSFSEPKTTEEILMLAYSKGWRPLQGNEIKMFADLSISGCEKGVYVNLLNFGTECFGEQYGDGPIPAAKVFDFHRTWEAGTFFTFVANKASVAPAPAPLPYAHRRGATSS